MQRDLGRARPEAWRPPSRPLVVAACYACFDDGGRAWAGAAATRHRRPIATAVACAPVAHPYQPGLLARREGPLLERALRSLVTPVDVVVVNATGRDHPRRAGLALHLGAALDVPTVGVTDRPLVASAGVPAAERGAAAPLELDGDCVGAVVRTRAGARPVVVHAAWRTDPDVALEVVMRCVRRARTPEPLRRARRAARVARAGGRRA
ncbi:MAG TPA: endonuclease V [Actinomycetota bacterium]|nr:endonuclease V [Actinomycetota bacterium]